MIHVNADDNTQDDEALVRQARRGDRAALGALLSRHYPSLLRLCRRLLATTPETEDVAQEAVLTACLSLQQLREPGRFGPWLHAIAANLARQHLRRRKALSLEALGEAPGVVTLWSAVPPDPLEVAALRELHDAIVAALWELSPLSREAVVGFYLEGYSYGELATLLGVPVGTLKGRLVFGRRRLKRRLAPWQSPAKPLSTLQKELPMSQPELIPVTVDSVRFHTVTQHRTMLLRDPESQRYLSIFIGPPEADAIVLALAGHQFPRPMTHDLSLRLLEPLGATIQRVIISRIADQTFFADIDVTVGERTYTVDARPSDAVALAVRSNAPVLVARAVLDQEGLRDELPELERLEPGTPPPQATTVLLVGELEEEREAIVGAILAAAIGVIVARAEPTVEQFLSIARGTVPRLAVVDLGQDGAERVELIAAVRQHAEHLPIIAIGGEKASALGAGATRHLARPLDAASLTRFVWDVACKPQRETM